MLGPASDNDVLGGERTLRGGDEPPATGLKVDRPDGDALNLTHELISLMLGVTRPGVTIAAGALQKAGLIQYSRGRLSIVDRAGLEATACECYAIVSAYYRSERG